MRRTVWIALAMVWLTWAGRASAQSAEAERRVARDLGNEGIELYEAGDYEASVDRLSRAYSVVRVPTLGLWLARAHREHGQLVEASERLEEVVRMEPDTEDPDVFKESVAQAKVELSELRPRIPAIEISVATVAGTEAVVTVDGLPVNAAVLVRPLPIDPGRHVVEAAWGTSTARVEVAVEEGGRQAVTLEPPPTSLPAEPPPTSLPAETPPPKGGSPLEDEGPSRGTMNRAGVVAVGVGAAGVLLGGVTGALALASRNELKDQGCVDRRCPPSASSDRKSYNALVGTSYGGFIVGGALAAVGSYLIVKSPRRSSAYVRPWVGIGSVGFGGDF